MQFKLIEKENDDVKEIFFGETGKEDTYHGEGSLYIINKSNNLKEEYSGSFSNGQIIRGTYRRFNHNILQKYNYFIKNLNERILKDKEKGYTYFLKYSGGKFTKGTDVSPFKEIEEAVDIEYYGGFENGKPSDNCAVLTIRKFKIPGCKQICKRETREYETVPEIFVEKYFSAVYNGRFDSGTLVQSEVEGVGSNRYVHNSPSNVKVNYTFNQLLGFTDITSTVLFNFEDSQ